MIGFDPNQTVKISPVELMHLPEEERPSYEYRLMSSREHKKVNQLFREADTTGDDDGYLDKVFEGIKVGLVGWHNQRVPFTGPDDIDNVDDVMTPADAWDMRNRLLGELMLKQMDKKKSVWQSVISQAKST